MFRDHEDAAQQLGIALARWRGRNAVVYAIPRGAATMGALLAQQLGADFDIVLTHKLGAPGNPEFAIGAVAESGWSHVQYRGPGIDADYIRRETALQLERLHQRRQRYGADSVSAAGRVAIVVDDGLATGSTMIAALQTLRAQGAQRLICAIPVAAPDSLRRVRPLADEVVCLHAPADFHAVGQYYDSFDQVEDDEVIAALRSARGPKPPELPHD